MKSFYKSIETIDSNLKKCEKMKPPASEVYEKKRLSLIKKRNIDLKNILEEQGVEGVFDFALSNAYSKNTFGRTSGFSNLYSRVINNKFYDPSYNDSLSLLFGKLPVNGAFTVRYINGLRKNKPSQYNCFIKKYIKDFKILSEIMRIVKATYIVKARQAILKKGIYYYKKGDYLLSIIILVAQVEGIMDDSLRLSEKDNVANTQTLSTKIDEIEKCSAMDFIKYTFEETRNDIAHGDIPNEKLLEKNFIIISSLHFAITELFGGAKEYNYLKINSLLEKWGNRNDTKNVISSFELLGTHFETLSLILFISPINKNYLLNNALKQQRNEILKFVCDIKNWKTISEYIHTKTIAINGKSFNISNIEQVLKLTMQYFKQYNASKLNDSEFKLIKKNVFKKVNA